VKRGGEPDRENDETERVDLFMNFCDYELTGKSKFFLIAGPCVIESRDLMMRTAEAVKAIAKRLNLHCIFKSSYDKANRSSLSSYRGPGLEAGLAVLDEIKREFALPVTTDVHTVDEISAVKEIVDLIQVPAFLCRQTDLLIGAAKTGLPVNVKKGQFLAPADVEHVIEKLRSAGCQSYAITERGYTFGYNNLVVDMRSLGIIRSLGVPVIFDATHSVQLPGAGKETGGEREFVSLLARSAVAAGIDGLFMEVHPDPEKALCDRSNQFPLESIEALLRVLLEIDAVVKGQN
jgi:2-dehydro-3-deoxyphosphooctonate aldolase (KDO 8-P synthase)